MSLNDFYRRKRQVRNLSYAIGVIVLLAIGYCFFKGCSGITIDDGYTTYFVKSYVESDGCVYFIDNFGRNHKLCGVYHISQ